MNHDELVGIVTKYVGYAKVAFANDLAAAPESALLTSPGGAARAPIDFAYEVMVVNHRIATRMRGEPVGPWPFEGWAVAPDEFRSLDAAKQGVEGSLDAVLAALGEDASAKVETSEGQQSRFELAIFATMHTLYHDAQLNYVQALGGDAEMHW